MVRKEYNDDPFQLSRFIKAQELEYDQAIKELKRGKKNGHWMWYIFPQMVGLGISHDSNYYGIKSRTESIAYQNHPVLGNRLRDCSHVILGLKENSISKIFSHPDDMKLRSSMTLFALINEHNSIFKQVLEKFFDGELDPLTVKILNP